MEYLKKKCVAGVILVMVLAAGIGVGCGKKESAPVQPSEVVARVGGREITAGELTRTVNSYTQRLLQQGQQPPPGFEGSILNLLIESELLYQAGLKMEIPDLDLMVDRIYRRVSSRYPSEQAFAEDLARGGLTLEDMRNSLKKETIVNYVLDKKVHSQIAVTDEEIMKFYDENQKSLEAPERIRVHHILVSVPRVATEEQKETARKETLALKKRIAEGEDFETLAESNSDDQASAPQGGDLGFMVKEQADPAFEEVAWNLETGQLSEPVETRFGYHLIRVDEKRAAGIPPPDEIRDKIVIVLRRREMPEKLKELVEEMKKEIKVEILRVN